MLEVCLPIYKRHYRFSKLLKQLREQTYQDFKLNIWNNTQRFDLDTRDFPRNRLQVFNTGKPNAGSQARFKLIPRISGNPIIFIDDDMELHKDFVKYNYEQYKKFGKKCILGWFTKTFTDEDYHRGYQLNGYGNEVDYVGTGGMILDREIFDKEESLQNIPAKYAKAEDLYLCAIARMKYKMELREIEKRGIIYYDGRDQCKNLATYKRKAFLSLRKEGWIVLNDK